jgi:hypothetical protein
MDCMEPVNSLDGTHSSRHTYWLGDAVHFHALFQLLDRCLFACVSLNYRRAINALQHKLTYPCQRCFCCCSQHHAPICDRSRFPIVHASNVCKSGHTMGWYPARMHCGGYDTHSYYLLVLWRCVAGEEQDYGEGDLGRET